MYKYYELCFAKPISYFISDCNHVLSALMNAVFAQLRHFDNQCTSQWLKIILSSMKIRHTNK